MKGYRKLVMTVLVAGAIMSEKWTGPFSAAQTELLQTLIITAFAGNGLEYVSEVIKDANYRRNTARVAGSVRSVAQPKTEAAGADAH